MNKPMESEALTRASTEAVAGAVTALFVPGDRADRFAKAAWARSDVVIVDLEDAVAPAKKDEALAAALNAFSSTRVFGGRGLVRVNPAGTPTHTVEVEALVRLSGCRGHGLLGVMVPKAEDPDALAALAERLTPANVAVVALVESAIGVLNAPVLARVPGLTRLAFGAIDFALDVNAGMDRGAEWTIDYARAALVVASRAGGLAAPLDSPSTEIADVEEVGASARRSRNFGFGGKLCIHPAQVSVVRTAFTPTPDQLAWAQSVLGAGEGATQIDGHMIDRPVIERARKILHRTGEER